MFKNSSSDSSNIQHLYSAKDLKWSIKYDLHKIRKRLLHASGILRSLLYKFIPTEDNQEFSNEEHNNDLYYVHEYLTAHTQATQQTDSLKTLAVSSCHSTNNDVQDKVLPANMFRTLTLPKLRRSEVHKGTKPYWITSKENMQQFSRESGWKEPLPNAEGQAPTLSQKLVREYVRKLLVNSNILKFRRAKKDKDKIQEICGRYRRKQLQFDYVENEGKAISESEDFNLLEKQYRQVKKMSQLLYAESCVVSEEWKSFQIVNWDICKEIGNTHNSIC
ncbi:hypothetical protein GmHk_01G001674 [Glycine max]|nr:hypothetical protein GmHk_01G001674 [Glycine max]